MTFSDPITGTYTPTRFVDYWTWDYSTSEPYAGERSSGASRTTDIGIPLMTLASSTDFWSSSPFTTRPNIPPQISGYDLKTFLYAGSNGHRANAAFSSGFSSIEGGDVFLPFIHEIGATWQIDLSFHTGSLVADPLTPGTLYQLDAKVRATGTEILVNGVTVDPAWAALTTANMPQYLVAKVGATGVGMDDRGGALEFHIVTAT